MHPALIRPALGRYVFRASQSITQAPTSHASLRFQLCFERVAKSQSRSIFGFFRTSRKKTQSTDLRPGFPLMVELQRRLGQQARPPAPAELAQAFGDFFRWHVKQTHALEDVEVSLLLTTYNHLRESNKEDRDFGLSDDVLRLALDNMTIMPQDQFRHAAHIQLAELLFEELLLRRSTVADEEKSRVLQDKDVTNFIQILSRGGNPRRARSLLEENSSVREGHDDRYALWLEVIKGLARQRATDEISNTIDIMQKYGLRFTARVHQCITSYYAIGQDFELTKKWYEEPIANGESPTKKTNREVLKLCIIQNELKWGDSIFKSMISSDMTLGDWGIVFQWALAQGKSVDEIERMMKVMVRRNEEKEISLNPDSTIINGLIRTAILKNDAYTAERCVALGQRWGVAPDAFTYLNQLEYRIKVGDLDGAQAAYQQLREQDLEDPKNRGVPRKLGPALNKLICALCTTARPQFEAIMPLVENLTKENALFETETICALARLHLQRTGLEDLTDLITTHVLPHGLKQRESVRDILVDFCLDQSQTIGRVWDAYNVLRHLFPELDIHARTNIMKNFFERGRSDMACHAFGHMRQQDVGPMRPTIDTYIACFEGIGKGGDQESLEMVHNMLKLDHQIEPNTKLYNSLMLAFIGCGEPRQSLQFWTDIIHSREGPTYRSIEIAFRACEEAPSGADTAREIWARLKRYKVAVSKEIFTAYIGALAGSDHYAECVNQIEEFEKLSTGFQPDALMYDLSPSKGITL